MYEVDDIVIMTIEDDMEHSFFREQNLCGTWTVFLLIFFSNLLESQI
jgi:hypothetical protein